MKAISVQNPWAHYITTGEKTIEVRSWSTEHRGDLLICSSSAPKIPGMISGHALCIVSLDDVTPFKKKHVEAACLDEMPDEGSYAWHLSNVRLIKPFPVKGKLNFYYIEDENIVEFEGENGELTDEERSLIWSECYVPLYHKLNKIGMYFKDKRDGTVVRWRVGQDELEYYYPKSKIWRLAKEGSDYDLDFYEGTVNCLKEITDAEAHKLLEAMGCAKPYDE